jgi:hypothetical protein
MVAKRDCRTKDEIMHLRRELLRIVEENRPLTVRGQLGPVKLRINEPNVDACTNAARRLRKVAWTLIRTGQSVVVS